MAGASISPARRGFDDRPGEKRRSEARQIVCGTGHRARCTCGRAPGFPAELPVGIVPVRNVSLELGAEDHPGSRHAERREHRLLHQQIERTLLLLLDHKLHQVDALAGVGESRTGIEMDVHLLVVLDRGEVAQARRVGEEHARRNPQPARVLHKERRRLSVRLVLIERLRQLRRDRGIEIELAPLDELHHIRREDTFRDRRCPSGRGARHRQRRIEAAHTERLAPDELPTIDDGDLRPGDVLRGQDFAR